MSKKRRHRIWWAALYEEEAKLAEKKKMLAEGTPLFDRKEVAYSVAAEKRLIVKRDENDQPILIDDYAQLNNRGRITMIGIPGRIVDWNKKQMAQKNTYINTDVLVLSEDTNLIGVKEVQLFEETDAQYLRSYQSPLAKRGGLVAPQKLVDAVQEKLIEDVEPTLN